MGRGAADGTQIKGRLQKKIPLFGKVSQQGGRGQPKIPTLFFEKVGNFLQGRGGL